MTQADLIKAARDAAVAHGLNSALVCAVCEQETAWNQWANRYEADFEASPTYGPVVRDQAHDFAATVLTKHGYDTTWQTEIKNRCMSWGLMQVMGQVARELGFTSPLTLLTDVSKGLEVGCMKLGKLVVAAKGDIRKALQDWNGGADPDYSNKVLNRTVKY